jgi:hypothetical protein
MLYREAVGNLWKNAEKTLNSIEGKKVALLNVRYDSEVLNSFVYTQFTISVRADIMEFV